MNFKIIISKLHQFRKLKISIANNYEFWMIFEQKFPFYIEIRPFSMGKRPKWEEKIGFKTNFRPFSIKNDQFQMKKPVTQ